METLTGFHRKNLLKSTCRLTARPPSPLTLTEILSKVFCTENETECHQTCIWKYSAWICLSKWVFYVYFMEAVYLSSIICLAKGIDKYLLYLTLRSQISYSDHPRLWCSLLLHWRMLWDSNLLRMSWYRMYAKPLWYSFIKQSFFNSFTERWCILQWNKSALRCFIVSALFFLAMCDWIHAGEESLIKNHWITFWFS